MAVNKDSGYTAVVKSDGTVWNTRVYAADHFVLGGEGRHSSYYFEKINKFSDVKEVVLGCDNMTALKENGDICYWGRLGDLL